MTNQTQSKVLAGISTANNSIEFGNKPTINIRMLTKPNSRESSRGNSMRNSLVEPNLTTFVPQTSKPIAALTTVQTLGDLRIINKPVQVKMNQFVTVEKKSINFSSSGKASTADEIDCKTMDTDRKSSEEEKQVVAQVTKFGHSSSSNGSIKI